MKNVFNGNGNGHSAVLEFHPTMTVPLSPTGRRADAWMAPQKPVVARIANWEHLGDSKRHIVIVESDPKAKAALIATIEAHEVLGVCSFTIVPDEKEAKRLFENDTASYLALIGQGRGMLFLIERLRSEIHQLDHLREELRLLAV
jgi:hypothetical protein